MSKVQRFGGNHTERKLEAVAGYLQAYVTVMKKQKFRITYVDAFAGSGASQPISPLNGDALLADEFYDSRSIVEGSPVRALMVDPGFDHYLFIDQDADNVRSLENIAGRFPHRNVSVEGRDANDSLLEFADKIDSNRLDRAVVFLDPFGLSVRWETVARLASTEKVDLWYLVPVHGMSRQIRSDGTFLPSARKIDEVWGSQDWRPEAVRSDFVEDLFGLGQRVEKVANAERFSEMFRMRLSEVFRGGVAKRYLPLGRGRLHDFSLMFACANPSPPAAGAALRIANHILGNR